MDEKVQENGISLFGDKKKLPLLFTFMEVNPIIWLYGNEKSLSLFSSIPMSIGYGSVFFQAKQVLISRIFISPFYIGQ